MLMAHEYIIWYKKHVNRLSFHLALFPRLYQSLSFNHFLCYICFSLFLIQAGLFMSLGITHLSVALLVPWSFVNLWDCFHPIFSDFHASLTCIRAVILHWLWSFVFKHIGKCLLLSSFIKRFNQSVKVA